MANLKNNLNEYVAAMGFGLFDEVPKAVLAAIAVSALTGGGDCLESAAERVAAEWQILHQNRIVPQRPGKLARDLAAKAEGRS